MRIAILALLAIVTAAAPWEDRWKVVEKLAKGPSADVRNALRADDPRRRAEAVWACLLEPCLADEARIRTHFEDPMLVPLRESRGMPYIERNEEFHRAVAAFVRTLRE